MKIKLLTIVGALLMICSSAFANEPSNNATGAKGAGDKAEGVCDCNLSQAPLVNNKKNHNGLLPDGAAGSPTKSSGSDASGPTNSSGTQ